MISDELNGYLEAEADKTEEFKRFQQRIICTSKRILGVRTPALRAIAKKFKGRYYELKDCPSDVYEVSFVKICAANYLGYEELVSELECILSEMDCWALTDTFKPNAIKKNRDRYIPVLLEQLKSGNEFYERFALVTLLNFYVEEKYLDLIFSCAESADNDKYYVHMASAWLIAEVAIKFFDRGEEYLKGDNLPDRTHNKAISKCSDSFRLTENQKVALKNLKKH